MIRFRVNDKSTTVNVPEDTPFLWVLREELQLKGTKFGCGKGICGSCTVHLNGKPARTCILPVSQVRNQSVHTIESRNQEPLHPVQLAWVKHNVPQCGYCQSGQIMLAIALLEEQRKWSAEELLSRMSLNLCRCGTYNRVRSAVLEAANNMGRLL